MSKTIDEGRAVMEHEIVAGAKFRSSLQTRADAWNGPYPLWHGWALMEAFLAGAAYANSDREEIRKVLDEAVDLLCGARSGHISGTHGDCEWSNQKDALLKRYAALATPSVSSGRES